MDVSGRNSSCEDIFAGNATKAIRRRRKRIETRLLTRQQKEWVGYSYVWNDEQTEATLVEASRTGSIKEFKDRMAGKKQTWHYPSRTECMVCHSRAANFCTRAHRSSDEPSS